MTLDRWLSRLPRRDWLSWVQCLAVIAAAVAVRVFFPIAGPFFSFYPAILFCALIGGRRFGELSLAVGLVVSPFFFGPDSYPVPALWAALSWLSFAVFGFLIIIAIDFQQRTLVTSRELTDSLQSQQHFTASLIAAAPSLTYIYDVASGHNLFISPQVKAILGYDPQDIAAMGPSVLATLLHPQDGARAASRFEGLQQNPEAVPPDIEYRMRRKDGSWVWLLSSERVFARDRSGKVLQILGVAADITTRKRFEEQLLESEERFRGIFENAPTGISISDIEGHFVQCNPAYERILGYTMDQLSKMSFVSVVHPDDRDENVEAMARLVRGEVPYFEIFNRSVHKSGRTVWVHKFVLLLKDRQDAPVNIVALVTDMTERKQQEEQIRLLMREVNHRSKNLLAVVQSVARQTASHGDPEHFAERFSERLQGLSASHDLLVHNAWRGVALDELVASQLSHLKDLIGSRIALSGPPLRVNAAAAQALGMALHELAVNAAKYGSLSSPEGRVAIRWQLEDDPGGPRLSFSWVEQGGPPAVPPQRSGLGTMILTRLAEQSLDAHVKLAFAPDGLSWRLSAPVEKVEEPAVVAH